MANQTSHILTPNDLLDIYKVAPLNDRECQELFTFSKEEFTVFKRFKDPKDSIYFALCLVFFKMKKTFVDFKYQEVTFEKAHLMRRYFPGHILSKKPPDKQRIFRIKNMVLELCEYQRLTKDLQDDLVEVLSTVASSHPRQRQLCKELLNIFNKRRIAIPGYSVLQNMVSRAWNQENKRVIQSYLRYTKASERQQLLSLLEKMDEKHVIISIKSDMKTFNTHDLWEEIEKQETLLPLFNIALGVLKQLKLPEATITYYGDLIFYYTGTRLSQLNPHMVGIYLLCYVYNRYQVLNDNLIEAFKKKTLMVQAKATDYAKNEAFKHLELIRTIRERVSQVLVTIDRYPEPSVPKVVLYQNLPQHEFLTAARLLVDESFDKDLLFWKYIDEEKGSIKLNLRPLFQAIQFVDIEHKEFNLGIDHLRDLLASKVDTSLPLFLREWIGKDYEKHLISGEHLIPHRFEFFVYQKMVQQIKSNKLSLKHSIKHKKVEDELYEPKKWRREKRPFLKRLGYPKLLSPIRKTLATKEKDLNNLYTLVNRSILDGTNKEVTIKTNKNGQKAWSLLPYEASPDNDEGILATMPQRGIVGIIQFVENQTHFSEVFDPLLPKNSKLQRNIGLIMAVVLANAIRIGSKKMAGISDVSESALLTAEASYVRVETLCLSTDRLNNEVSKMPIYKEWYINGIPHGSLDGMKIETRLKNIKARGSSKYFPLGTGVSSYNEIMNGLSIAGKLIGSHEYEGSHTFEMAQHLNTSMIKPSHLSTDKHGKNSLNFALFDFVEMIFCPRIPKIHREALWGFGSPSDYEGYIIKPTHFVDQKLIESEWDNIQRMAASIIAGEANPSVIIQKLSAKEYSSRTKRAFVQYNNIVKSHFILQYIHESGFRRAVTDALNRGEKYNSLYRAITLLNNGQLKGTSEIEMEIWNQCTRLIAAIIHYYNSYILNELYINAKTKEEKAFIAQFLPTAWGHVNFLGRYEFCVETKNDWINEWIKAFDWKAKKNVEP